MDFMQVYRQAAAIVYRSYLYQLSMGCIGGEGGLHSCIVLRDMYVNFN